MTTSTRPRRALRVRLALLAIVGAVAALVLPAQAAHAANYQYWGYYQVVAGKWTFYQVGADKSAPKDGSIEGWRWAIDDGKTPRLPRALPSFTDVCDTTAAETGKKRVAVVIDYGRAADGDGKATPPEPLAKCASVATAASGAEVVAAVAEVRAEKAQICGLDGYPAAGCSGEVATLTDVQKAADTPVTIAPATVAAPSADATAAPSTTAPVAASSSGIPVGVWMGILVVILGVAALGWSARRRRQTSA